MPSGDQLPECLVLPAMFRPAIQSHFVNTIRTTSCGDWDAGAIPAASTFRPGLWKRKSGFFMDLGRLLLSHNDLGIGSVSDNVSDKSLEGVR